MNTLKIVASALILAGVLGLGYGGFSYTQQTHEIQIGPLEMHVQERHRVNVPVWAGAGAIAIGAALLVLAGRRT
ncbi:MAG TPA: hypothetical protein VFI92_09585 [Steroidobacteraceae bacterium]|nr:hypothetical protein [Steroidobacteraceae bacterium]